MSSSPVKWKKVPLRPTQSVLLEDIFWNEAFNSGIPFSIVDQKNFRIALLEGYADVLDVHEEAKCYVKHDHLTPIILRLIQLAPVYPQSDFVETLSYFIIREPQNSILKKTISNYDQKSLREIKKDCTAVCKSLIALGDDDLSENFKIFLSSINRRGQTR